MMEVDRFTEAMIQLSNHIAHRNMEINFMLRRKFIGGIFNVLFQNESKTGFLSNSFIQAGNNKINDRSDIGFRILSPALNEVMLKNVENMIHKIIITLVDKHICFRNFFIVKPHRTVFTFPQAPP